MTKPLECLDGPEGCDGPVEYRTTPDRTDFRHFPRCEAHFQRRLDQAEETMRKYPTLQPTDFDPSYAGERWEED